ncbi:MULTISPECIES: LysR family transcriptional regulator [unclassified Variovorax]|uniref:LysR family transcriptional regulator n=1 Tax=unclassified Variovorax TaxID=663243 RepID=UPI001BD2A58A|nr:MULTISPECIES: LysR family transcriptional regulator [unclassified Variovorax]
MDLLSKLKAFIATADAGNFSEAARNSYVSPSVIMKRVDALEWDLKTTLFERSTRRLTLTDTGQSYLTHARQMIRSYNDMVSGAILNPGSIEGPIRIKAPAVFVRRGLGDLFAAYRAENPLVQLEIIASDRGGNPATEGFDIAVGMHQMSFPDVIEQVIRAFPRLLCAAPSYLARREAPLHPRDLIDHPCLAFSIAGRSGDSARRKGAWKWTCGPSSSPMTPTTCAPPHAAGKGSSSLRGRVLPTPCRPGNSSLCWSNSRWWNGG